MIRMLLIDPDDYYHTHFQASGPWARFFSARNAEEGKNFLEKEEVDLIVTELLLPDISGFDFISDLRHQRARLPIVVFSRAANVEDTIEAMKRGADAYFVKGRDDIEEVKAHIVNRLLINANL